MAVVVQLQGEAAGIELVTALAAVMDETAIGEHGPVRFVPWPDGVLTALSDLSPEQALERLGSNASQDISGVFFRIVSPGNAPEVQPAAVAEAHPLEDGVGSRPPTARGRRSQAHARPRSGVRVPAGLGGALPRPLNELEPRATPSR